MLPGTASEVGVGRQSLLAGVDGCERQRGYCRVCSVTGDKRVAWIVRLVKTEADGEERCADVMKIDRPDDLADIADLGLTLAEGKLLLAGLQQEIVAAQAGDHAVRRPDSRSCGGVCRLTRRSLIAWKGVATCQAISLAISLLQGAWIGG